SMPPARPFAALLRRERDAHQLTQRELARKVRVSPPTVVSWEKGDYEPGIRQVAALGMLFGWDFNRTMKAFGARLLDNPDRIGSEIAVRPSLLRLFRAAREPKNTEIDFISEAAQTRAKVSARTAAVEKDE